MANSTDNTAEAPKLPSAFTLFGPSFRALWLNIVPLICVAFVPAFVLGLLAVLMISASFIRGDAGDNVVLNTFTLVFGLLAILFFLLVVLPATFYLQLAGAQGKKVGVEQTIKDSFKLFPRVFVLCLVVGLIVIVGLILFIIPGLFMIKRYWLSVYFLIDKDLKVFEAMRQSKDASKVYSGPIWGLMGVSFLVQVAGWIVGFIPVLGQVVSFVFTTVYGYAPAVRYQEIKNAKS